MAAILCYTMWLCVRVLVCDYFTIPTSSMYPTLKPGDKVLVNKVSFGARIYKDFHFNPKGQKLESFRTKGLQPVKVNDIVVFNTPNYKGSIRFIINKLMCKRIVGLPGDSVRSIDGHLINNNFIGDIGLKSAQEELSGIPDSTIDSSLFRVSPKDEHIGWNIKNWGPIYVPRKGDVIKLTPANASLYDVILKYEIHNKVEWDWTTGKVFTNDSCIKDHTFNHNYYFVCGDNIKESYDSRYWGFIPEEFLVGVVKKIIPY